MLKDGFWEQPIDDHTIEFHNAPDEDSNKCTFFLTANKHMTHSTMNLNYW